MFTITSRDELGEILFQRISTLEPELAEVLTSIILDMKDEDVIPLVGDDDALQAQVQRLLDDFDRNLMAVDDVVNWDDEPTERIQRIFTPSSSSDRTRWSPSAESTIQRAAVIADSEDIEDHSQASGVETSATFLPTIENQDPQVTDDYAHRHGPTESTRVPANSEATKEVAGENSRSQYEATEFVETIRRPAELDTMKESVAASTAPQTQETRVGTAQDYRSHSPLTSTSTASYVLGAERETAAPASPAPKKKAGKKAAKIPRAPEHVAADHSHPLVETGAPASMPLMEAVRQPEPPLRAQDLTQTAWRPARRTTRPGDTGARAQELDDGFADGTVIGTLMKRDHAPEGKRLI
ncbi:hypothetical protein INS49_002513 [Diaporthe citri]|uniref:uncharacterized protein n=1 Tax=Diaporthe citri TaxID=83186 RepID=UPI001C80B3F1|nr:uncharacterized protein INS49_002513 [Diaporthe citri]KAG6368308.1 hypothetical protein INS49_002513 [Diaporthe citri]